MAINKGAEILLRYGIAMIVVVAALVLPIFYVIFRPLTVYPVYWLLNFCYDIALNDLQSMIINGIGIEIIDACIAGSAYTLLFLLNALTRDLSFKKRVVLFVFDALLLLALNILRLLILINMVVHSSVAFDFTHKFFWYVLSTVFVIAIWFLSIWFFRIKAIPFYSDVKFLIEQRKLQ
ncbi:MAG: pacearchaeosortase [Candidatus Pacearchaeota archaeon]